MILYSSTYITFINRLNILAKKILSQEMHLRIRGNRFYLGNFSYPLQIVIFEDPQRLGYFKANLYEIGINKAIITAKLDVLMNLLRHEIAHYMMYIKYGQLEPDHGTQFRKLCKSYGWNQEAYLARINLEKENTLDEVTDKILSRVKKLLALSSSSNTHESEAATLKVNELLLKYNLEHMDTFNNLEMTLLRVLKEKRTSAKLQAISSIVRSFFVFTVINHGKTSVYLELFGSKTNVKIAEYVAHFLNHEMDKLWNDKKKSNPKLKGLSSKNSFFRGLARGYKTKYMQKASDKKALLTIAAHLNESIQMAFPKLTRSYSSFKHCEASSQLGIQTGQQLQIRPGINSTSDIPTFLLK